MNPLHGWDGKSALIGGALALGGLAAATGGLLPLLLVSGLVFLIGGKKGWWGDGPRRAEPGSMGHQPPGGPPFLAEWHRQAHAAGTSNQAAADEPTGQ